MANPITLLHNTHERADHLCTCLPGGKKNTHAHPVHTCKYTLTGHKKRKERIVIFTPPPPPPTTHHTRCFSSPATLSFFSSIIVVFHNHPELMVQMTGPATLKIVALGPKIGKQKKKKGKKQREGK